MFLFDRSRAAWCRWLPGLLLALATALGAQAHEGEDHGDAPHPVATSLAPRFAARSELFELVGVLQGGQWLLYLDRAESNAPVTQATVELESGAFKAQAQPGADGVFRLPAGALAEPGRHAITLSIDDGQDADLLSAVFNQPAPEHQAQGTGWPGAEVFSVRNVLLALALPLVALLAFARLRRRHHKS